MIRFSIRRPVAVGMLYAALALLGVASWLNVPVELLPETELPRLRITAQWPGASPEIDGGVPHLADRGGGAAGARGGEGDQHLAGGARA